MRTDRSSHVAPIIEALLVAVGLVCLARYASMSYEIARLEDGNRAAVSRALERPVPIAPEADAPPPRDDGVIGELDIPRLSLSAAVITGDDSRILAGAVGYLADTALPWEDGNTALAAHRDRLFRPLQRIREGDEIRLSTRHGTFEYRVVRTFVVTAADVWVLGAAPDVDLTLITCYPFVFVGHAPNRFIVRARKVSPAW